MEPHLPTPWTKLAPLIPLVVMTAYFVGALAIFSVRARLHGLPADPEVTGRPASRLLGRYLRHYLMWVLRPWERGLARVGISPNGITLASLLTALGAAVCLATGHFGAGGWLYLITGILDILDGRIARATGRVTVGGAFFDSVIDRYAELAVFSGLAWFYADRWVLGVVLAAAMGSFMVSYVRARGEALGVDVKIGTMQRPERLFYLGMCVAQSPLWETFVPSASALQGGKPLYAPAVIALALLGVSANLTAVRRIKHTLRALAEREPALAQAPVRDSATAIPVRDRKTLGQGMEAGARRLLSLLRPVG